MPITPIAQVKNDVDSLTRELLDRLKNRNAALRAELANNQETISILEKRLNLQPTQGSLLDDTPRPSPAASGKREAGQNPIVRFRSGTFFGLTQKDAAIKLLRLTGQPMKVGDMVESLTASGFSFKSKSAYKILWKTLSETPEVQKQGPQFGLHEWKEQGNSGNGKFEATNTPEDSEADSE
jgi:hypothetical protein